MSLSRCSPRSVSSTLNELSASPARQDHLAAVARGGHASGEVDVVPDVALIGEQRGARVQPHAHPDRTRRERTREGRAAARAPGAVGKAKKNASPWVSTSTPPSAAQCLADHAAMLGESLRIGLGSELVQQSRRALDVREEEGDRAGGEVGPHVAQIMCLPTHVV